jgi:SAM-dependent methyltransferase
MADGARDGRVCWCGGALGAEVAPSYRRCVDCGTAVLATRLEAGHFTVEDDERDFYGRAYWTDAPAARDLPDIGARARADLSERCVFWLERLLAVVRPPGRVLEIGCGHGGFVRLLQELGFEAAGTELSPWVVDFARRTFGVPVHLGPIEALGLPPGFACIASFDVLEHVSDPLGLMRRCADLLAPDGVLLLQTPCYRGEGPGWSMFQEPEHVHLFTEASVRQLLARAGLGDVRVGPSLFPYDMWVAAARGRLPAPAAVGADLTPGLPAVFRALLDVSAGARRTREELAAAEADRAARLTQVEALTAQVREVEAARLAQVEVLTARVRELEADGAARLAQIEALTAQVREVEAARRADAEELGRLLRESEADRAARLEIINRLTDRLHEAQSEHATYDRIVRGLESRLQELQRRWIVQLEAKISQLLGGRGR